MATRTAVRSKGRKTGKLQIKVDPRTLSMTMEVLICRAMNHPWEEVPQGEQRRLELVPQGQTEEVWTCIRCDSMRYDLVDLMSGNFIGKSRIEYSDAYKILRRFKGTGRLSRAEVRKARHARRLAA